MFTRGSGSSEFWLAIVAVALVILNDVLGLNLSPEDIYAITGISIGYGGARAWTKGKTTKVTSPNTSMGGENAT